MSDLVKDNPELNRYEIYVGDELAGFAEYKLVGKRMTFPHTEIEPRFGGRGLGSTLVQFALNDAQSRGLEVLPLCPFVAKAIGKNPEKYLDLVPQDERHRFPLLNSTS